MNRVLMCCGAVAVAVALALGYGVGRARAFGVPNASPGALSYTGSLLTFGQPDNNTHTITVALWPNGATSAACTSGAGSVQVVNGQFTVPLPAACVGVIHQNQNVQVQTTIDGTTLGMTALSAVPYALEAGSVTAAAMLTNVGLSASVASGALTIELLQGDGATAPTATSPAIISFPNSAPSSGALAMVQLTSVVSITVPSAATLGQSSGVTAYTYVYAQDVAGAVQLCVNSSGTLDEGTAQTAVVINSSSQSLTALYCQTAAVGAVHLVGRVQSTQATAGTWATSPTSVTVAPFSAPGLRVPTITKELSSSGTYTTPTSPAPLYLLVKVVGGGGGGGGGGTTSGNGGGGGTGGTTSFGPLSAAGGGGGGAGSGAGAGGAGGGVSVGSGAVTVVALAGSFGAGGNYENAAIGNQAGGSGGSSPFGGQGGGQTCTLGQSGVANSGSGGAGGGTGATAGSEAGSGGGSGGYIEAIIGSPAASYAYSIGGGGGAGAWNATDGCGGPGGSGGSGMVIIEEHYQ